jgi:L-threonylcarbamoyladenylate synthase
MTSSIRDIAYQLRQGQLIALADETGWSVAADPVNDAAVDKLLALRSAMPAGLYPTVVIHNTDQLGLYVAKLPDVAYDLVEFAENPLTVVYEQGKNVSVSLLSVQPEIAVRRSLTPPTQQLIGSFGRGLLTVPFESLVLPAATEGLFWAKYGTLPTVLKRPRIMRLKMNGEVGFIRK